MEESELIKSVINLILECVPGDQHNAPKSYAIPKSSVKKLIKLFNIKSRGRKEVEMSLDHALANIV